jgi:hypothetical protein
MKPTVEDIDLMLRADGELTKAEEDVIEAALQDDAALQLKAQSLVQVGEVIRGQLELAVDDAEVDSSALWQAIEKRMVANGASGPALAAPKSSAADAQPVGLLQSVSVWFENYRAHFVTGVLSAAAASIILFAVTNRTQEPVAPGESPVAGVTKRVEPGAALPVQLASQPMEVESLEVYEGSGTVITLGGDDDEDSTAVIWLSPAETEETLEGPI